MAATFKRKIKFRSFLKEPNRKVAGPHFLKYKKAIFSEIQFSSLPVSAFAVAFVGDMKKSRRGFSPNAQKS